MASSAGCEVAIVGGGVVGLSLAYELTRHGTRVAVFDQPSPGWQASWAGAGILPPARRRSGDHPLQQLTGLSYELHPVWHEQLRAETGIDNGFRRCGGLYVAASEAELPVVQLQAAFWREQDFRVRELSPAELAELEPALRRSGDQPPFASVVLLEEESQLRNPRHLKALTTACLARGVTIHTGNRVDDLIVEGSRVVGLRTAEGDVATGSVCVAAGAWSGALLRRASPAPQVKPLRGQMALLNVGRPILRRIVNSGSRYIVPRDDGRVLVGSTEEQAGFDCGTTAEAIAELLHMALRLAPALAGAPLEASWAGLRPKTGDGLPYLGPLPGLENAFAACGHYRSGLTLSIATAVVVAELIRGVAPTVDLGPFRLDR